MPAESAVALRDSVLNLLVIFASGPRPIQTQLCVCLASLAIQMTQWKDVLAVVGATLGGSAGDCVLEFLRILPEEVTEGRKINLSVRSADTTPPVHRLFHHNRQPLRRRVSMIQSLIRMAFNRKRISSTVRKNSWRTMPSR